MSSRALYRKYRSKSLDEIVGQSHITDVLRRSIDQGRIAHAYLLTGPRGVGKTSVARILAHEINQLPYDEEAGHLDIIEIDAASNNGVEDVRDLRDKVQIAPVKAKKKVYIIDEVHMLSKPAFNALLKTLEEPPEHIVFILATTDAHKLPETIISRTQQFNFRTIRDEDAEKQLAMIAKKEGIKIDAEALKLIAKRADGSFRDAISLLDQLASLSDKKTGISRELALQTLGLASADIVESLLEAHQSQDLAQVVSLLDEIDQLGISPTVLTSQLIETIQARIVQSPELLPLIDQLLDVAPSTQPGIKLLTVLARPQQRAASKPKTSALLAHTPVIEAPIKELEEKATQEKPQDSAPPTVKKSGPTKELDWKALIAHTKIHHVALYSVLVKCTPHQDEQGLTLYTVNNFYKKKLDDPKYRALLAASLESVGLPEVVIDTIPTTSPLRDEQTAKVAAIMGGGEEVSL